MQNTNQLQLCSCCGNIVNQKEIAFTTQLPQIKLGVGVRLYFTTLIHYTIVFLVTFVMYSLYTMITNINASSKSRCTQRNKFRISVDIAESVRQRISVREPNWPPMRISKMNWPCNLCQDSCAYSFGLLFSSKIITMTALFKNS